MYQVDSQSVDKPSVLRATSGYADAPQTLPPATTQQSECYLAPAQQPHHTAPIILTDASTTIANLQPPQVTPYHGYQHFATSSQHEGWQGPQTGQPGQTRGAHQSQPVAFAATFNTHAALRPGHSTQQQPVSYLAPVNTSSAHVTTAHASATGSSMDNVPNVHAQLHSPPAMATHPSMEPHETGILARASALEDAVATLARDYEELRASSGSSTFRTYAERELQITRVQIQQLRVDLAAIATYIPTGMSNGRWEDLAVTVPDAIPGCVHTLHGCGDTCDPVPKPNPALEIVEVAEPQHFQYPLLRVGGPKAGNQYLPGLSDVFRDWFRRQSRVYPLPGEDPHHLIAFNMVQRAVRSILRTKRYLNSYGPLTAENEHPLLTDQVREALNAAARHYAQAHREAERRPMIDAWPIPLPSMEKVRRMLNEAKDDRVVSHCQDDRIRLKQPAASNFFSGDDSDHPLAETYTREARRRRRKRELQAQQAPSTAQGPGLYTAPTGTTEAQEWRPTRVRDSLLAQQPQGISATPSNGKRNRSHTSKSPAPQRGRHTDAPTRDVWQGRTRARCSQTVPPRVPSPAPSPAQSMEFDQGPATEDDEGEPVVTAEEG